MSPVRAAEPLRPAGDLPFASVWASFLLRLAGGLPFASVWGPFLLRSAGGCGAQISGEYARMGESERREQGEEVREHGRAA